MSKAVHQTTRAVYPKISVAEWWKRRQAHQQHSIPPATTTITTTKILTLEEYKEKYPERYILNATVQAKQTEASDVQQQTTTVDHRQSPTNVLPFSNDSFGHGKHHHNGGTREDGHDDEQHHKEASSSNDGTRWEDRKPDGQHHQEKEEGATTGSSGSSSSIFSLSSLPSLTPPHNAPPNGGGGRGGATDGSLDATAGVTLSSLQHLTGCVQKKSGTMVSWSGWLRTDIIDALNLRRHTLPLDLIADHSQREGMQAFRQLEWWYDRCNMLKEGNAHLHIGAGGGFYTPENDEKPWVVCGTNHSNQKCGSGC
eukprot:TRINITY_DN66127_c3_g2_i4.p1 TRINITY_DN66127_c3_g2~~TRINITY_DN66127_c3_g2_i4.p1  ORF type:complete len:322 (-),score=66.29 TRINITY_DN66127_c3_g2_i4:1248-2180(-)